MKKVSKIIAVLMLMPIFGYLFMVYNFGKFANEKITLLADYQDQISYEEVAVNKFLFNFTLKKIKYHSLLVYADEINLKLPPFSGKQLVGHIKGNGVTPELLPPDEDFLYAPEANTKISVNFQEDSMEITLFYDDKNPLVLNLASSKQKAYEFSSPATIKIKLASKDNLLNLEVRGENNYKKFAQAAKYTKSLRAKYLPLLSDMEIHSLAPAVELTEDVAKDAINTKISLVASFDLDSLAAINQIKKGTEIANTINKIQHPLIFNLDLKQQDPIYQTTLNTSFSFDKAEGKLDVTNSIKALDKADTNNASQLLTANSEIKTNIQYNATNNKLQGSIELTHQDKAYEKMLSSSFGLDTAEAKLDLIASIKLLDASMTKKFNDHYAQIILKELKENIPAAHISAALDILAANSKFQSQLKYDFADKKIQGLISLDYEDKPSFAIADIEASLLNLKKAIITINNPEEKITKLYDFSSKAIAPLYKDFKGDEVQLLALLELIKNSGLNFLANFNQDNMIKSGENFTLTIAESPSDHSMIINQQPVLEIMQKPAIMKFISDWNTIIATTTVPNPNSAPNSNTSIQQQQVMNPATETVIAPPNSSAPINSNTQEATTTIPPLPPLPQVNHDQSTQTTTTAPNIAPAVMPAEQSLPNTTAPAAPQSTTTNTTPAPAANPAQPQATPVATTPAEPLPVVHPATPATTNAIPALPALPAINNPTTPAKVGAK